MGAPWKVERKIVCAKCGIEFSGVVAWNRKYCDNCIKEVRRMWGNRHYAQVGKFKRGSAYRKEAWAKYCAKLSGKEKKIKRSNYGAVLAQAVWDKAGHKCARCGIDDWRVLNIHHISYTGKPKDCVLLCANCHAITHYEEREKCRGQKAM